MKNKVTFFKRSLDLKTRCKDGFVSTVDLLGNDEEGYYFETMVYVGDSEEIVARYRKSGEAILGHAKYVNALGGRTLLQP